MARVKRPYAVPWLVMCRGAGGNESRADGRAAVDELRTHRRFADEAQKTLALSVINAWMDEVNASTISDGMKDVRYELMRDLRLPPFDT